MSSSVIANPTEEEPQSETNPSKSSPKAKSKSTDTEVKQEETPQLQDLTIAAKNKQNIENSENNSNASGSEESEYETDSDESSDDEDTEMFVGMSKEAILKMKEKMGVMQVGYNDVLEKEKTRQIKETQHQIEFNLGISVNDDEAAFINGKIEEYNYNLQEQLQDEGVVFLHSMKEMMEQQSKSSANANTNTNNNENDIFWENNSDDSDEDWIANEKKKKAKRAAKRKSKGVDKMVNLDGSKRCGRLLLNDALKNMASRDGWSEARKKAYDNRKKSPNAYFYRFNVPGQAQKNGKWTLAEHKLFMERVLDIGVNDSWGIFSKTIPGRVGYQCSNYWRGLVKDGEVTDPNYHFDGKKLHFKRNTKTFGISTEYRKYAIIINKDPSKVWTDLPKRHPKHPKQEYCDQVRDALSGKTYPSKNGNANNKNKKSKKKKKRKRGGNDSDEDWDSKPSKKRKRRNDDTFYCGVTINSAKEECDNPMPDFIDIMTGTTVVKPTISPYGHVLGYETWTKILRTSKHKNMCPFTMQRMTRRGLVKLTKSNYEEYKDKISNITKEQTDLMTQMNKEQ